MALSASRLLYLISMALFFILAPWLVLEASGYSWQGWPKGFSASGALVVYSTPRTQVFVNGTARGQTPLRLAHLQPGTYTVELRKPSYHPWSSRIIITAHTAEVIGPVTLFPERLERRTLSVAKDERILSDEVTQTIFAAAPINGQWGVRQVWPIGNATSWQLPDEPIDVRWSPQRQLLVASSRDHTYVLAPLSPTTPWVLAPTNHIFWSNISDNIFFGQRGTELIRFDALARSEFPFRTIDAAGSYRGSVWFTEVVGTSTTLFRQNSFGQDAATAMAVFDGQWRVDPSVADGLLLRSAERQVMLIQTDPLSGAIQRTNLGLADRIFWPDSRLPAIWQSGVTINTTDARGNTVLLDRGPQEFQRAGWLIENHLLYSFDGSSLIFRGASARQGRSVAYSEVLTDGTRLLVMNVAKRQAVLFVPGTSDQIVILDW